MTNLRIDFDGENVSNHNGAQYFSYLVHATFYIFIISSSKV